MNGKVYCVRADRASVNAARAKEVDSDEIDDAAENECGKKDDIEASKTIE